MGTATLPQLHTPPNSVKCRRKQKPANKHSGSDVCKTFDKPGILSLSLHQKRRRFPIGFSPLQYNLTSTPKSNFHWPEYKCII